MPFEPASKQAACLDDTDLLTAQESAGSSVIHFIKLGKIFKEEVEEREAITEEVNKAFAELQIEVESRISQIYSILLFFTIKVWPYVPVVIIRIMVYAICSWV